MSIPFLLANEPFRSKLRPITVGTLVLPTGHLGYRRDISMKWASAMCRLRSMFIDMNSSIGNIINIQKVRYLKSVISKCVALPSMTETQIREISSTTETTQTAVLNGASTLRHNLMHFHGARYCWNPCFIQTLLELVHIVFTDEKEFD